MTNYLGVGDWVQISKISPWTKIIEPETWCRNAIDSNHVKVGVSSKPYKILRKGSVYVQTVGSSNYLILFERMEGKNAYGPVIFPVLETLRDNVKFMEDEVTVFELELAENQEYWLSCFAAEKILKTDKYEMACEMLNIKERKDMTTDIKEPSIKEQLAKVQIDFSMIEGEDRERESTEIQEFLFKNGCEWASGGKVVQCTDLAKYILTGHYKSNQLTYSQNDQHYLDYENKYTYLEFKDKFMSNDSLKVGDKVKVSYVHEDITPEKVYEVTSIYPNTVYFIDDVGDRHGVSKKEVKKVYSTESNTQEVEEVNALKVGDYFEFLGTESQDIVDWLGVKHGKTYKIMEVDESSYQFVNDSGLAKQCYKERVKKAAKPETDSKETIFKVGDYFEIVDEISDNVCDFGVKNGDVYQIVRASSTYVVFTAPYGDSLIISTNSIKKAIKPQEETEEDNKLSEKIANLEAENKKQAEMLNLAWSDLSEYDNAYSFRSKLVEFLRERVGTAHDLYSGRLEASQDNYANLLGEMSKFCLLYTSPSPRDGLLSRMPSSA